MRILLVIKRSSIGQLRTDLEQYLKNNRQDSLTVNQILEGLILREQDRAILLNLMKKMQSEGALIKSEQGRFGLPEKLGLLTGILRGNRKGFAFLLPEQKTEDVYISASNLNNAAHGDRVVVRVEQKKGRRREGTVIGIIERGRNRHIGTLHRDRKRFFVIPDDSRFADAVQVATADLNKAKPGEKVVVEIEKWARGNRPARGVVAERIGLPGSPRTDRLTFKYRFDLPGEFPPAVIKVLEELPGEEMIARAVGEEGRADLRHLQMVTIDDQSARDFDDAVSLELPEGGNYHLGVHIADVSHYVNQGQALDREAFKRGTSIYLVEKVIHMLPPLLSENLCSLQAGKDRLALSVIMDIDREGELLSAQYTASVIRVTERLTYQQVEAHLKGEEPQPAFKSGGLTEMLDRMKELAGILRKRRMARGALDLDLPEARIEVDDQGVPLAITKRAMGQSESLIEEFMVYCNEAVAGYLFKRKLPCVYRVHTLPTIEKLAVLRETLSLMGVSALAKHKILKPKHLNQLLEQTRGEKAERLVRYLVLRSLPQAQYSAVNEGHFGLASACYCHFTSPIRRYPDLLVHRILKQQLAPGGLKREKIKSLQTRLPEMAQHSSERERAAVEAERASIEMKKAQYMEQKIGEIYSGIINGVTNFGLFVELENTVEGLIPISELKDDYYFYNEKAASLTGERNRKSFHLGDPIDI
ncbi:MAG: ribonuclease R, partial [Firmicutes bacterium]|nr:ribonuclease R [Bacillota bacterium]